MTSIILGMHRSGTSVLANILDELGWSVGHSPMLPAGENPHGFYENRLIMDLHDEILFEANSTWSDPHPIDDAHWTVASLERWSERVHNLLESEFPADSTRLIKDPRMCRLLPLWRHALGESWGATLFLLPVRHPLEVAGSLKSRDGLSIEYGILLWLTHLLESERHTRGTKRLVLQQDRLIQGAENDRIATFAGKDKKAVAEAHAKVVSPGLRHHYYLDAEILPGTLLGDLASRAWQAVISFAAGTDDPKFWDELRCQHMEHLIYLPREFCGTVSTGPLMTQRKIVSLIEFADETGEQSGHARALLQKRGAEFDASFHLPAGRWGELRWTILLDGPAEFEGLRACLGEKEMSIEPINSIDEKNGAHRFVEDEAQFRLGIIAIDGIEEMVSGGEINISGSMRIIPPNRMAKEFVVRSFLRIPDEVEPLVEDPTDEDPTDEDSAHEDPAHEDPAHEDPARHPEDCEPPVSDRIIAGPPGDFEELLEEMGFEDEPDDETEWDWLPIELAPPDESLSVGGCIAYGILTRQPVAMVTDVNRTAYGKTHLMMISDVLNLAKAQVVPLAIEGLSTYRRSKLAAAYPSVFLRIRKFRNACRAIRKSGLFDANYYQNQCGEGFRPKNPLLHYVVAGWRFGLHPHPLINGSAIAHLPSEPPLLSYLGKQAAGSVQPNPLFDPVYYLRAYPDVAAAGLHPLEHFLKFGVTSARSPHPMFDMAWYQQAYPEVVKAGLNPLLHYLDEGHRQGFRPHPLFDTAYYRSQLSEADRDLEPVAHFLSKGAGGLLSPHPLFDVSWYVENCSAAGIAGEHPFIHFILYGARAGSSPHPLFDAPYYLAQYGHLIPKGGNPLEDFLANGHERNPCGLFDSSYYRIKYPDIAQSGTHPLLHFLETGASEGRDPSALFDISYYKKKYGHLIRPGENPLIHYRIHGERIGCKPNPLFDPAWYASRYAALLNGSTSFLEHFVTQGSSACLRPCPLFDTSWYIAKYPDVAKSGTNPLAHYLGCGALQGFKPNPLFDSTWYLEHYQEVARMGLNPLGHFIENGAFEGFSPNPVFDSGWYLSQHPELAAARINPLEHYLATGASQGFDPHPLFDSRWYLKRYPQVASWNLNPLAHYLESGLQQGLWPHPLFDPEWYLEKHPAVVAAGIQPFIHFVSSGSREGFQPHPLFDAGWYFYRYPAARASGLDPLPHYLLVGAAQGYQPSLLFDAEWYLEMNPGVREAGMNPLIHYVSQFGKASPSPHPLFDTQFYLKQCPELEHIPIPPLIHYLRFGANQGRNPHKLFNTSWYLKSYPEVAEAGFNPFFHYIASGSPEGRSPSPLFDGQYYLESNPDVVKAGMNSLLHYLEIGAFEGRDPNRMFDSEAYLEEHEDVAKAGVNPLMHYLGSGEAEGRLIPGRFDPVFYAKQLPRRPASGLLLEHYIRYGAAKGLLPTPMEVFFDLVAPAYVSLPREEKPVVSIVIPVFNQSAFSLNCLATIANTATEVPYEVILVDDCSTDETGTLAYRIFNLNYLRNETNLGFGGACNRGAAAARGEFVLFLNNDTRVKEGWLDAMLHAARLPKAGYVGAKLIYPNGRLQEAGGIVWEDSSAWNYGNGDDPENPIYNYLRKTDYCSAAAAMVPAALFHQLGGFSPDYERAYYEDTDLCMRIRSAGYDVIYQPLAEIVHFEGATCGKDINLGVKRYQVVNRSVFEEKWKDVLPLHRANGDVEGHIKRHYPAGTVLFIDDLLPFPKISSGGQRAWNLIVVLLNLGYHVTVLPHCGCNFNVDEQREALRALGVQVLEPPASAWLDRKHSMFELTQYDKVIVARHYIASFLYERIRHEMPKASIIFDTVDLHYQRLRREAKITGNPEALVKADLAYEEEISLLRSCEQTWVVSDVEKTELQRIHAGADVRVVSNIVEVPGPRNAFEQRSGLLFIGGFNHPPNLDAVLWFVRDVLPLVLRQIPDLVFHILGSKMPEEFHKLASPNVNPVGFVDDPGEWFEQVRLSVAPLRYGAGVKGKVNQSLSYGVPVVGTGIAFEGMGIPSGTCVMSAEDPATMARQIIAVYNTPGLWNDLSVNGVRLMEELYSLDAARNAVAGAMSGIRR